VGGILMELNTVGASLGENLVMGKNLGMDVLERRGNIGNVDIVLFFFVQKNKQIHQNTLFLGHQGVEPGFTLW
jgi:hypothetical protein